MQRTDPGPLREQQVLSSTETSLPPPEFLLVVAATIKGQNVTSRALSGPFSALRSPHLRQAFSICSVHSFFEGRHPGQKQEKRLERRMGEQSGVAAASAGPASGRPGQEDQGFQTTWACLKRRRKKKRRKGEEGKGEKGRLKNSDYLHVIKYIVLVNCHMLFELTEKLALGAVLSYPHFRPKHV